MKLEKILCCLILFNFIFMMVLLNIDDSVKITPILEEISKDGKYKISFNEEQKIDSKNIEVVVYYKKDSVWDATLPYYIKFMINDKCKISKSNFIINWYSDFFKITYKDNGDNTLKSYRIYFKDLEGDVEQKRI